MERMPLDREDVRSIPIVGVTCYVWQARWYSSWSTMMKRAGNSSKLPWYASTRTIAADGAMSDQDDTVVGNASCFKSRASGGKSACWPGTCMVSWMTTSRRRPSSWAELSGWMQAFLATDKREGGARSSESRTSSGLEVPLAAGSEYGVG